MSEGKQYYEITIRARIEVKEGDNAFSDAIQLGSRLAIMVEHADFGVLEAQCVEGKEINRPQTIGERE